MAKSETCFVLDIIKVVKKYLLLALVFATVFEYTTSAPLPGCKGKAKRVKLKDFLPKFNKGNWLLMERVQKTVEIPRLDFTRRNKRDVTSRPSDVPATFCPWRWEYDFDRNREPQYLPQAVCNNCNTRICKKVELTHKVMVKSCEKIHARGQTIDLWKKSSVTLPIAFYYKKPV